MSRKKSMWNQMLEIVFGSPVRKKRKRKRTRGLTQKMLRAGYRNIKDVPKNFR